MYPYFCKCFLFNFVKNEYFKKLLPKVHFTTNFLHKISYDFEDLSMFSTRSMHIQRKNQWLHSESKKRSAKLLKRRQIKSN